MTIHIFSRNLHLLSFPTIYSLPYFPLKWRAYEFFSGGHGRTPTKVRSNLKLISAIEIMIALDEGERIPNLVLGVLCHTARKKSKFSL